MNNSNKTQQFFSDTVKGSNETFIPSKEFVFGKHTNEGIYSNLVNNIYNSFSGNFDKHIACSIPLFRESQVNKILYLNNILLENNNKLSILDIGGSEATMLKTLKSFARTISDLELYNLEPNKDMQETNKGFGIEILPFAFLEGFEDVKKFETDKKFDVINETMTFQFIKKDRKEFVEEVKRFLSSDGVFITDEKFTLKDSEKMRIHEEIKDKRHKSFYFDSKSISDKKEVVLTGMQDLQSDKEDYLQVLKSNFKFVIEYYKAGNFSGFICTDSIDKVELLNKTVNLGLVYNVFNK